MNEPNAGGSAAKRLIFPAVLILLAILVFLGWRGVFSPDPSGVSGIARAPVADAPAGTAGPGGVGQAARPAIPPAPTPPDLASPTTEAARPDTSAGPAAAAMIPPRFDVVRVGARGSAVVAGRAAPGAEVMLFADNGRELGRARADRRGEFVILPVDALPPGAMELSLRSRLGDQEMAGPDTVVLMVPDTAPQIAEAPRAAPATEPSASAQAQAAERPAQQAQAAPAPAERRAQAEAPAPTGPLAVLIPGRSEATAPRVLQVPEPTPPAGTAPRLGIDSVEYDQGGSIRFAGSATPGARLRLYVDDRPIGEAVAETPGRWTLQPESQPSIGRHRLRVDQVSPTDGRVVARAEVPFEREELPAEAFSQQRIVVQPGNNLWRIARATYGRGVRYTVIYQANKDQIADPNRIYPGQVFALPNPLPAPAASSRSR
ncbi:MAG: LysM peptidoglycan-binding domain-containing protein [Alphaproteobacteria bacterium]|nr:LysM peptidoglycan-binding domain-containing protein [Alphaproteobacteria bacterium]